MLDVSIYEGLPFQLPRSSSAASLAPLSPAASASPPPPAHPRPARPPPPRPPAHELHPPSKGHDGHPDASPLRGAAPAASSAMPRATRQQSLAAAHPSGQREVGEATAAESPRTSSSSLTRPAPPDEHRSARKGIRASRAARTAQPPAASAGSSALRIVLRAPAKLDSSPASTVPPPSSTPTPTVIVLDSSSSSSVATSRAETPAAPPEHRPTSTAPGPSTPGAPPTDEMSSPDPLGSPGSSRKGQKNGKDGLNRVCHMHKSQTDRQRMTCINAPDCRTVWCSKCVVKHYLACTPNNAFEPASLFLCPVCLDVCLCSNCKKKRRSSGRRSASVDIPDDDDATYGPPPSKKKRRRTSSVSEVAGLGLGITRGMRGAEEDSSDSSDEDASVSRLLTGAAVGGVVALEQEHVPTQALAPVPPPVAPAPAPPPTLTIKVKPPRRRGSLDCAYDRANPITFRPTPPAPPQLVAPVPLAPAPAAPARRRSTAPRPPRPPRPPRATPAPAPTPDPLLAHSSVFAPLVPTPSSAPTYNSRPIVHTAAATRSRRTKRPSTAFDDYALDSATSSAAGLGDRYSPSLEAALSGSRVSAAARRASPAPLAPKLRKAPRRYSGISSASSCDELSSDDDGFDDAFDDAAPMRVVEEQPLPVLAGLEKNLEDAQREGESLTFDEFGLALPLGGELEAPPRRKVKWIEGPERRRRRAMAAAAAAAAVSGESPSAPAPAAAPSPAPAPPAAAAAADPPKPPSPAIARLPLPAPGETFKPFGSRSPAPAGADKKPVLAPAPAPSAAVPMAIDDQPPPYESHFPPGAATAPARPADDDLRSRSPTDAKLAFALLDAVRAAVAPREGSSSSGSSSGGSSGGGGFGAAIEAAFAGVSSSPSKRSAAASPAPRVPAAADVDLDAANAEAERRRASLAAAAEVDPGKAFKPLAKDRADAQFFGAPAAGDDEDEPVGGGGGGEDAAPLLGRRDTDASSSAAFALEFDDVFELEFEIGSPVDDLWTPASAADSVGASARSVSTAPSSAFDDRASADAHADALFPPEPPHGCVSPTRGLAVVGALAFEGILPLALPLGASASAASEIWGAGGAGVAPMEDVRAA
ncbi:hypothetical protein JCM10450v2_006370 [Rhodotorula kratochvilovae]